MVEGLPGLSDIVSANLFSTRGILVGDELTRSLLLSLDNFTS